MLHTMTPFFNLSPGNPITLLHICCLGSEGHLETTMSPFLTFSLRMDIRSVNKTSLVCNVGSIEGPAHFARKEKYICYLDISKKIIRVANSRRMHFSYHHDIS